ncbi:Hint domain-containing protein [Pseudohalocynthiibacter aestuariivivens]|nr:Hint domain-containing protein [Pseudohalocynthiibacter aestuariivivens]QIE47042.1 Hint domain-containing protein [Pseudohalocynthiibacter aestuariivivens]
MPDIDIVRLETNPHETVNGIRADTTTRGVDLEGSKITATYADGTTETLIWQAFDPYTNGGVIGTDINMSYGNSSHLLKTTKLLTSLRFDIQPADSVFDTTVTEDDDPSGGSTPTSKIGFPFEVTPAYADLPGDISVTYSGIVNLAGSPPAGDLFTTMTIDFSDLDAGGLLGDLEWKTDIDTVKDAGDLKPSGVTCFTRGTMITTDQGALPIETLKSGAYVLTQDNGFQELKMVISRTVGKKELEKNPKLYPVRITAKALGSGLPARDLVVSRQHRMVAQSTIVKRMFGSSSVLIASIRLTRLPGIYVDTSFDSVEYFHLIFENHEVIFAEATPTESFLICPEARNTLHPAAWAEFATLFPDALAASHTATPVRAIPNNILQKRMVNRHIKNAKDLFCAKL